MIITLNDPYASENKLADNTRKYGVSFRVYRVLPEPVELTQQVTEEVDFIDDDDDD